MSAPVRFAGRWTASLATRRIESSVPSKVAPSFSKTRAPLPQAARGRHTIGDHARSITSLAQTQTAPLRRRATVGHNSEAVPESAPETDFERMDVLGATPTPATSVDVCMSDGFALNSGAKILDGDGALLVGGEAFAWRPWDPATKRLVNDRGQWEVPEEAFAVFGILWPRPDLLILGLGPEIRPLSPRTRKHLSSLGMRVEVLDTRNAASQFNLLATERGVDDVAAALIPIGWREGFGANQ